MEKFGKIAREIEWNERLNPHNHSTYYPNCVVGMWLPFLCLLEFQRIEGNSGLESIGIEPTDSNSPLISLEDQSCLQDIQPIFTMQTFGIN